MTPQRFSTHALPVAQQLDAWRCWFESMFEVVPGEPARQGFRAESHAWALNGLILSRVSAPSIRVTRTRTLVRRNPVDHWVITLGHRVATAISTDAVCVQAPPAIPFVLSLGDEMVSERDHDQRTHLYLARDAFRELAPALDAARGTVLDTPLGHLLGDYIVMLERHVPDMAADAAPRLARAVGAMVGACVAPEAGRLALAAGQIELGQLERVRRAVRSHLRSPALGVRTLCRMVGVSRSQLYRMLEGAGGAAHFIQRERLREAHALLCDPSHRKPIAAIAEELCFADASVFSRAFRREFSVSPGEARSAALAGMPPPAMRHDAGEPGARTMGDCLRSF